MCGPAHEFTSPSVGSTVTKGAEQFFIIGGGDRALNQRQSRVKLERVRGSQPLGVVLVSYTLPVRTGVTPEQTHSV